MSYFEKYRIIFSDDKINIKLRKYQRSRFNPAVDLRLCVCLTIFLGAKLIWPHFTIFPRLIQYGLRNLRANLKENISWNEFSTSKIPKIYLKAP